MARDVDYDQDDGPREARTARAVKARVERVERDRTPGVALDARMARLDAALERLGEGLDRAEEALAPVLTGERATPGQVSEIRAEAESHLARTLDTFTDRIESHCARLGYLLDRVDL